jgi:hypothetical protein
MDLPENILQLFSRFRKGESVMLYLGHFVFDTFDEEQRMGYFNLLVAAEDVEKAKESFRRRLLHLRESSDLFTGHIKMYLDGIVELSQLPEDALLTNYRTFHGDAPPSIYNVLPEQNRAGCAAYPVIPDKSMVPCPKLEPFISFA